MSRDDGGSAFPVALGWIETDTNSGAQTVVDVRDVSHGMTLRDYFAAKAMQGFCTDPTITTGDDSIIAEAAYSMADAMLTARSQS